MASYLPTQDEVQQWKKQHEEWKKQREIEMEKERSLLLEKERIEKNQCIHDCLIGIRSKIKTNIERGQPAFPIQFCIPSKYEEDVIQAMKEQGLKMMKREVQVKLTDQFQGLFRGYQQMYVPTGEVVLFFDELL
jgi:wobble nucleotide-excising tRNase